MPREILRFLDYRRKMNEAATVPPPPVPTPATASTATSPTPPGTPGIADPTGSAPGAPTTDPTTGLPSTPTSASTSSGLQDPLSASGAVPPPAAVPPVAIPAYKMVFVDDTVGWETRTSDGGGSKKFTEYEIEEPDLDSWLTDKGWTADKTEFQNMLRGDKHNVPAKKITSLRKDMESKKIGNEMGETEVDFDDKEQKYIGDLDVVFITKKADS